MKKILMRKQTNETKPNKTNEAPHIIMREEKKWEKMNKNDFLDQN